MRFVIVTGMSGAGKSSALKILEDFGFFCVDNLPIKLIDTFADLTFNPTSDLEKVAMGIDIRSGEMLAKLTDSLDILNEKKQDYEILFLEANDNVLLKRYKESRRKHPLSKYGNVEDGIRKEREKLAFLKKRADYIIDTSNILVRDLRGELDKIFIDNGLFKNLYVRIISFGYK
ncbi:MAG TPA: RNase adaptor protein RapZ, partial [Eubacterium sp.]|nr:RNase adaptor protein RapZ [Eubacterium sp.]